MQISKTINVNNVQKPVNYIPHFFGANPKNDTTLFVHGANETVDLSNYLLYNV